MSITERPVCEETLERRLRVAIVEKRLFAPPSTPLQGEILDLFVAGAMPILREVAAGSALQQAGQVMYERESAVIVREEQQDARDASLSKREGDVLDRETRATTREREAEEMDAHLVECLLDLAKREQAWAERWERVGALAVIALAVVAFLRAVFCLR